jgi:AraC family transcriptional regulator
VTRNGRFSVGGGLHGGRVAPSSFGGGPDASWSAAAEALLVQLVAAAARAEDVRTARAKPWLRDVHDLVRDSAPARYSLGELAETAGVHPVTLARSFKRSYGRTVQEYGRAVRLDWAARQLASDVPIARVACEAGFADQSHFTRAFRKHTGVTPGRYRALVQA